MQSSNGMSQGTDTSVSASNTSSASPAPAQAAPATQDERIFKQSEVNEIVKKAKHGAVEDYRRLSTEQPQYAEQKFGSQPSDQRQLQQPNQGYAPSQDEIRRLASEEVARAREADRNDQQSRMETEYANRVVQNFNAKIQSGRDKYQDFDKVTGDMQLGKFPYVVQLLGDHVENAADMLYEFGNDRTKMAQLEWLAERSPQDAIKQAQRLSQSLKDNEAARSKRLPNEPLTQLRPSNTGTDNGVMGVSDYRKKYKV